MPTGFAEQRDNARSADSAAPIVVHFRAATVILADGIESGTVSAWSSVVL